MFFVYLTYISGFIGLILLYFTIKPLIALLYLKVKHGDNISILYYPIWGEGYYMEKNKEKYGNYNYHRWNSGNVNPK